MLALMRAVIEGSLEEVKLLVDWGEDVNEVDDYTGRTVLGEAIRGGNLEMVQYLVEHGAYVNGDVETETPLEVAISCNNLEMVRYLVEHRASVNEVDRREPPIVIAARYNNLEIVRYLVEHRAYVNLEDVNGNIAFMYAVWNGNKDMIEYLVSEGAYVEHTNKEGRSALSIAMEKNDTELVKYLIDNLIKIDSEDDPNKIYFMLKWNEWYSKAIEYLIAHKVKLDFKNIPDETLLYYNILSENQGLNESKREITKRLLEKDEMVKNLCEHIEISFSRLQRDHSEIYNIVSGLLKNEDILNRVIKNDIRKIDVIFMKKGGCRVIFRGRDGRASMRYVRKYGEMEFIEKKKTSKKRSDIVSLLRRPKKLIKKICRYIIMRSITYGNLYEDCSDISKKLPRNMKEPGM